MSRDMSMSNNIRNPGKHKAWLDNEYNEWVKALGECTVHNFKEHPVVKRMLGEPDVELWAKTCNNWNGVNADLVTKIESIGLTEQATDASRKSLARFFRYVYYAQQILKLNPSSICEIGGGVGQFYATLRALGWEGDYCIMDLPQVRGFHRKYLDEVAKITGIDTKLELFESEDSPEMVISFYALGEFDDSLKRDYATYVINNCNHGYIAWNPHSGASDDLSIFSAHDIKVTPGVEPGVKIIQW